MRLALVAMPWNLYSFPSPALGILAAVIRREQPEYQLNCKYAYMTVAERMGTDIYPVIGGQRMLGDIIYAGHLYPEKKEPARSFFVQQMKEINDGAEFRTLPSSSYEDLFEWIFQSTGTHLEELASELAGNYDVIGFTTTYIQLFASLATSKRLKEVDPSLIIVFGGAGVALEAGQSILDEYLFVDHIIQGDGEWQFLDFLNEVEAGHKSGRSVYKSVGGPGAIVPDLDKSPVPDYDQYAELAGEHGSIYWYIPIEGSRGCWWDRVQRTANPRDACCFCNLSGSVYREKSATRIAQEMEVLSERYSNVKFRFTDCVMRPKGIIELATAVRQLGRRFDFFYEVRASLHPYELLLLWEAGCRRVQVGVEGLSSSYLRRIGKGTTTIQNLQAMKTCFELGIVSISNLLTDFPGSTQAEVEETVHNVLNYAVAYQPLNRSIFRLERNSCVYKLAGQFMISNVRNADEFKSALPEEVWKRLRLNRLDYDCIGDTADWSEVESTLKTWHDLHRSLRHETNTIDYFILAPLYYEDRNTYLDVVDRRNGFGVIELDNEWREVFLYCMEIRNRRNVMKQFSERYGAEKVQEMLDAFVAEKLMFVEEGKYLSLATATYPHIAAERIRKDHKLPEED